MEFLRKFMYEGFEAGNFTYGTVHIGSLIFLFTALIVSIILLRGKEKKTIYKYMKIVAFVTIVVYIWRHAVDVYRGKDFLEAFWPMYICNVNTVLMSIWLLFGIEKGKDFLMITGMFGAILMFVVPDNIFVDRYLTLGTMDSLLSHFMIFYVPLVLLFTRAYELDIKKYWQVVIGLLLVVFNVEVIQKVLFNTNEDYLFLRGSLPFTIEGVPQFIIVFASAFMTVFVIYFINYLLCGKLEMFKEDIQIKRS